MTYKSLMIALVMGLTVLTAQADLIPTKEYTNEVTDVPEKQGLHLVQNSSWRINYQFLQQGIAKDITAGTSVIFTYAPPDRSWEVPVTGGLIDGTNGTCYVIFTPLDLATNSNETVFSWILRVSDGSDTLAYAYGDLDISEDVSMTASGVLPIGTTLNWGTYTNYQNTATAGAWLAGTNILFTANSNGSVNVNVAESSSLTITAGDGINVTTNSDDRLIAVDNTVIRADGSVDFAANQAMGDFKITGLGTGTATNDAVNKMQMDAADTAVSNAALHINGDNAMTGNLNLGSQSISNAANITANGTLTVTESNALAITVFKNQDTTGATIVTAENDTSFNRISLFNVGSEHAVLETNSYGISGSGYSEMYIINSGNKGINFQTEVGDTHVPTTATTKVRISPAGALLIGTNAASGSELLRVAGDARIDSTSSNTPALHVVVSDTQVANNDLFLIENASGTDKFKVDEDGDTIASGFVASSSKSGSYSELQAGGLAAVGSGPWLSFTDTTAGHDNFILLVNSDQFTAYNSISGKYFMEIDEASLEFRIPDYKLVVSNDAQIVSTSTNSAAFHIIIPSSGMVANQDHIILEDAGGNDIFTIDMYDAVYFAGSLKANGGKFEVTTSSSDCRLQGKNDSNTVKFQLFADATGYTLDQFAIGTTVASNSAAFTVLGDTSLHGDLGVQDIAALGNASVAEGMTISGLSATSATIPLDVQATNAAGVSDYLQRWGDSADATEAWVAGDGEFNTDIGVNIGGGAGLFSLSQLKMDGGSGATILNVSNGDHLSIYPTSGTLLLGENLFGVGKATDIMLTTKSATATNQTTYDASGDWSMPQNLDVGETLNIGGTTSASEGDITWSEADKTYQIKALESEIQINQQQVVLAVNNTGSTIPNGKLVYINGASDCCPQIGLASASEPIKEDVLGWTTAEFSNGETNFVTFSGKILDLNTDVFAVNDHIYLSTEGNWTNTPGEKAIKVGHVLVSDPTVGVILAHVPVVAELTALNWSTADLTGFFAGGDAEIFGTVYETESTGNDFSFPLTNEIIAETYNRHIVFNVTNLISAGTLDLVGSRVNEDTGAVSVTNETINVQSAGYYQSDFKYVGAVTGTSSDISIEYDLITTTYLDFQNRDFQLYSVRFAWTPDDSTWDVGLSISKVNEDGSLTNLDPSGLLLHDSGDTPARAADGVSGHVKVKPATGFINGGSKEGLVVQVTGDGSTPTGILMSDVFLGCYVQ